MSVSTDVPQDVNKDYVVCHSWCKKLLSTVSNSDRDIDFSYQELSSKKDKEITSNAIYLLLIFNIIAAR